MSNTKKQKRKTRHEGLVAEAEAAIDAVFDDLSVEPEQTAESLRDLADSIRIKLACLKSDQRRRTGDDG